MAVKQNNPDNDNCSSSSSASGQNMTKSGAQKNSSREISEILEFIDAILQKENEFLHRQNFMSNCRFRIILELATVTMPRESEEIKRFNQDIAKIGKFLAQVEDENRTTTYLQYLRVVCNLLTSEEPPKCAIAIVFHLFPEDLITKAVSLVLSSNEHASDDEIRRTVKVLCNWLHCSFCQNLHLWILAILNGLREQQKYELLFNIAMDVIDQLFVLLIVPLFRPKVAPLVFHILSSVKHTPAVFHKIVGKAPKLLKQLKGESAESENSKKFLQDLVDLLTALISQFPGPDELYKQTEEALMEFSPSYDYRSVLSYPVWNYPGKAITKTNLRTGLVNLGNTCYMNSILQALAMTKEFARDVLLLQTKSSVLSRIQELLALMFYSSRSEITPSAVLNATRPPWFVSGFQQDSSEYLSYLLEMLNEQESIHNKCTTTSVKSPKPTFRFSGGGLMRSESETKEATNKKYEFPSNEYGRRLGGDNSASSEKLMEISSPESINPEEGATSCSPPARRSNVNQPQVNNNNNNIRVDTTEGNHDCDLTVSDTGTTAMKGDPETIIEKTFSGQITTTYKCLTCGQQSKNTDNFRELQLAFPEVKADCGVSNYSVQDLLDYYCSSEKLCGDNQYFCGKCKKLTDAERFINVVRSPKNLILTLKHFKYDQRHHMRAKLMHKVFHDESVSLKVYSSETLDEKALVNYNLYAAVVHSGFSMDSGHYYTFASDTSDKWFKFNDNIITSCSISELHNLNTPNTPYILFYQMKSQHMMNAAAAEDNGVMETDEVNEEDNVGDEENCENKSIDGSSNNKSDKKEGKRRNSGNISKISVSTLNDDLTTRTIPIKVVDLPSLEELPSYLKDYIVRDNSRIRQLNLNNSSTSKNNGGSSSSTSSSSSSTYNKHSKGGGGGDSDDDPPSTCGGNALNHVNKFVF